MAGVVVLGFIVITIIAFSDDPNKPPIWILIALFMAFVLFAYVLFRIMKFMKETIIEDHIRD